jgi:glutaryl-CoA dehydrogenase
MLFKNKIKTLKRIVILNNKMKKVNYMNLFKQFNKIDTTIQMISKSVNQITKSSYVESCDLLHFNSFNYKKLYRDWGQLGIFNHLDNEICPLTYGLINYNIEKVDSSLRSAYSVQSSLVINPIEKFGTEYIKDKYLKKLYSGDHIGCFGLTEPDSGSDPASIKTKAVEKDYYYIVNGSKTWITNSPIADIFIIWCKDENDKIIGLITERKEGIETPYLKDKMSLLASPTGQIFLNDVKIPKENKLDVTGLKGPFDCLNKARYGISWGVVGAMEDIINTTIDYTENRKQFSKKLNSFQLIQNDLVNCIQLYNNSLNNSFSSLNCIKSFDDLKNNVGLISYLKKVNCENALIVSRICRDILGGNGVANSYNIFRHLINLEAVNTYEGTKNIHNLIMGREFLGENAFV